MHAASGKCKQLFQHTGHARLQNITSIQHVHLRLAMQCHSRCKKHWLKECWRNKEGEETQNWMWILNKGSTAKNNWFVSSIITHNLSFLLSLNKKNQFHPSHDCLNSLSPFVCCLFWKIPMLLMAIKGNKKGSGNIALQSDDKLIYILSTDSTYPAFQP